MATRGKGEGSIFKDARGLWTVSVELPPLAGKRRRKVIRSKDKAVVVSKLGALKTELARSGDMPSASLTVEQWMNTWLERIAPKRVRPNTLAGYKAVVNNQIVPSIGRVRLDKLTPAHVRKVHEHVTSAGRSSTYALNAHRVLAKALVDAERDGLVSRNVARLTDAPRRAKSKLEALDVEEAVDIIARAIPELDGATDVYDQEPARWSTYLLTGVRRGELLGLEVDRIVSTFTLDPETGEMIEEKQLDLSWQLQRITDISTAPADYEYRHITGTLYWTRPKTAAGWRVIPLVDPLRTILERHIERTGPNAYGLVFTTGEGQPIDPDTESGRWPEALKEMGITKKVRLHDLRHTTVDLLGEAGVDEDVIMEIVGHSVRAVTRAYKDPKKLARRRRAMMQLSELVNRSPAG